MPGQNPHVRGTPGSESYRSVSAVAWSERKARRAVLPLLVVVALAVSGTAVGPAPVGAVPVSGTAVTGTTIGARASGPQSIGQSSPLERVREAGILVLAAASLTDVLIPVAEAWSERSGVPVRFSFDATSRLAPQAVAGAPADVFIAADEHWMRWLEERGAVAAGSSRAVAGNVLVGIVPAGRSGEAGSAALASARTLGLAGENVPAGRYAREALSSVGLWADVEPQVVTGGSVRTVLEWVARADVEAGVVYRSDALAEPAVRVVDTFAPTAHRPIRYWAAPLVDGPATAAAASFIDFLLDPIAVALYRQAGFTVPADDFAQEDVPAQVVTERVAPTLPSISSAIRLSLVVALLATLAGLLPAIGLGWLLARHDFRGKVVVSTVVLAPLVIPPVVTGFLLLSVFGSQSWIGAALEGVGLQVPFSVVGAAVAALIVGIPLYVLSVRGAFEAIDPQYEELSWTLGHPPRRTFLRISLPLALPGIAAGAILAFARALGEFGATVVLAGNVEGSTRTIALAVYTLLESPSGRGATWTLVGASVGLSLLALVGYEALTRRQRARLNDGHAR